jgi:hypothetical protein
MVVAEVDESDKGFALCVNSTLSRVCSTGMYQCLSGTVCEGDQ